VTRANSVIERIVDLQDSDSRSPTFGNWSWYIEEPLKRMAPPDLNWAAFCGARITEALIRFEKFLHPPIKAKMRDSAARASACIVKRNVGPGYTNIAALSARVTLCTGELLDDQALVSYGRSALRSLVSHTHKHGSFNEYNSPTYTMVALNEFESVIAYVRDTAAISNAEALRRITWEIIAEHFHAPTKQWAGPHARAYTDLLSPTIYGELLARTDFKKTKINSSTSAHFLPCPDDLAGNFVSTPAKPLAIRRRFICADDDSQSIYGTTWMDTDATIGSANRESFWTQRRPLIAYWKSTREKTPAVFRVRMIKDDRDFASFGMSVQQHERQLLLATYPIAGAGDFHIHLDRPADGQFAARTLLWRFELTSDDATIAETAPGSFLFTSGETRLAMRVGPAIIDGRGKLSLENVKWRLGQADRKKFLDIIVYEGERWTFVPENLLDTVLTAAITLHKPGDATSIGQVTVTPSKGDRCIVTCGELALDAPVRARPEQPRVS
jgi:hypothetical protein